MKTFDQIEKELNAAPYDVAIISPSKSGIHGEIVQGFLDANNAAGNPVRAYAVSAQNLKSSNIKLCIDEILSQSCDLVVTVGLKCTRLTRDAMKENGVEIPHLFIGVDKPVKRGIIIPGKTKHITGITYNTPEAADMVDFLHRCKPDVKRVLIPYEPSIETSDIAMTEWLCGKFNEIINLCAARGITARVTEQFSSLEETAQYLKKQIKDDQCDTVMLLNGLTVLNIHKELSSICSEHNVTLYTGMTAGTQYGSALGYGANSAQLGAKALEYAQTILYDKISPDQMTPYCFSAIYHPQFNRSIAPRQGLDLNDLEEASKDFNTEIFASAEIDSVKST